MTAGNDDIAAKHRRLAEVEAALAALRAQYDMLMNAFKFDDAKALQRRIETTERAHRDLAAQTPPVPDPPPTPYRVARGRRRR